MSVVTVPEVDAPQPLLRAEVSSCMPPTSPQLIGAVRAAR